ncbi:MAG: SDR family NAD(P)-dependent oxidoreductase [Fusobacterium sp.]|nr:SDR family NAD(P)-dependent oxidoreductase [Fusobacterium sp.]MDO5788397.1 SDR family NAD(P)-dependent oxidoreductase [Fusobacterium sp.]
MFSTNRVKGKIALITGATSGIGKSCAIALAKLGMNLIITGRRENLLIELKKELEEKFSVQVLAIQLDVKNADEVKDKLSSISDEWKNIDILINNAGLAAGLDKLYHNSTEDISNVIDTNIKGLLYVTNAIVPHMIERDVPATIINIGSVAGDAAYAGGAVYCASKAAVKILSDGLRIDLVDTKIKVTDVKPGLVETNFSLVRFKGDEERAKKVYQGVEPLTPDDVAETVAYIANLPDNVHIAEITLLCNNQADGRTIYKQS